MDKIEHLGIAVKDLKSANQVYTKLFGKLPYKNETIDSEGVSTSFFKIGESKIELLQAIREDSAIAKFIKKNGEGIHHIAFAVNDIKTEIERMRKEGFIVLTDEPKKGADNKLVCFLHPKTTNGVLIDYVKKLANNSSIGLFVM